MRGAIGDGERVHIADTASSLPHQLLINARVGSRPVIALGIWSTGDSLVVAHYAWDSYRLV